MKKCADMNKNEQKKILKNPPSLLMKINVFTASSANAVAELKKSKPPVDQEMMKEYQVNPQRQQEMHSI